MNSFQELNLPAFLHESLKKMKFEKPTPVQAQAIPVALQGKDVIASAETGSGKTAAFGIPLLAFLEKHRDRTALVLVPTRELADQVRGVLKELACGRHEYDSALLIGGVGMGAQVDSLRRGARLVIGTPGRINDHLQRKTLHLSRAGFLVLDEADRMLDMGFAPQLDRIRQFLTAPRQTLLFSATMPPDMQSMASKYLTDPVRIAVGANARPVESIRQAILHTSQARKMDDLVEELKTREGSILIFGRTQHRVDRLSKKLKEAGFANARIHGGRTQGQRRIALEEFKEGRARILVATDIAARGLDISHIAHVINFDLPQVAEDYVHRVGRTARAGAEGDSLSLLTPEDRDLWKDVLKTLGSAQTTLKTLPSHFKDHPTPQANPERMRAQTPSHPSQGRQGRPQGHPAQGHGRSNIPGATVTPAMAREDTQDNPAATTPPARTGLPIVRTRTVPIGERRENPKVPIQARGTTLFEGETTGRTTPGASANTKGTWTATARILAATPARTTTVPNALATAMGTARPRGTTPRGPRTTGPMGDPALVPRTTRPPIR